VCNLDVFDGSQVPQEILSDLILSRARNVDEALRLLETLPPIGPFSGGVSLLFADAAGTARQVDLTGKSIEVIPPANSIWITTNHFRGELSRLNNRSDQMCVRLEENSRSRYRRAIETFRDGCPDVAQMKALMREDRVHGAWLRTGVWPDVGYTTASYLIDLQSKQLEFWLGSDAASSRCLNYEVLFRHGKSARSRHV